MVCAGVIFLMCLVSPLNAKKRNTQLYFSAFPIQNVDFKIRGGGGEGANKMCV